MMNLDSHRNEIKLYEIGLNFIGLCWKMWNEMTKIWNFILYILRSDSYTKKSIFFEYLLKALRAKFWNYLNNIYNINVM